MKRRHDRLTDCRKLIEAVFIVCRKVMLDGIQKTGTDSDGRGFVPLAESTKERKARQGLPSKTLLARGAMTAGKTFGTRVSKQGGRMKHKTPKGSHTNYKTGKMGRASKQTVGQRLGQSTVQVAKTAKYDYGLAHQYSTTPWLPRRQWWLEPGSKKWVAVQNMIPRLTKEFLNAPTSSPYALVSSVFVGTGFK